MYNSFNRKLSLLYDLTYILEKFYIKMLLERCMKGCHQIRAVERYFAHWNLGGLYTHL